MLARLHSHNGANVVAKIGDLGSAAVCASPDVRVFEEIGSSGYTAPEVFQPSGYDARADVWSLGVVLWELLVDSRERNPFVGRAGDDVLRLVHEGVRPSCADAPAPLVALLQACWLVDPSQRPTAHEVAQALQAIARSHHSLESC
ncbi:hypothetical protein PINS_up005003 [Pythium insidiosum]|nr:hypothetical protein PINS_up005003 [Pythium insidiosum]